MEKPLREHYENDIGHLAVFNYINDLEKYINHIENVKNLQVNTKNEVEEFYNYLDDVFKPKNQ